ncbi:MAG: hypothetical protein HY084_12045 [Gemmatimonadetes bacterium]|nr:hypothetical protein [Gemmatimonadota bacterium]
MTYEEFLHAIRSAAAVASVDELLVFGSQAILALNPDPPAALKQSVELDVVPYRHPERWEAIDGQLGEQSQFHLTHGFYVQGVGFETATFPARWETRCLRVPVGRPPIVVICPELHDLAASKLAAGRDKDFSYVSVLIEHELIDTHKLIRRVAKLPVPPDERVRLRAWIGAVANGLSRRRTPNHDSTAE